MDNEDIWDEFDEMMKGIDDMLDKLRKMHPDQYVWTSITVGPMKKTYEKKTRPPKGELEKMLAKAIKEERYEDAATIRDLLK